MFSRWTVAIYSETFLYFPSAAPGRRPYAAPIAYIVRAIALIRFPPTRFPLDTRRCFSGVSLIKRTQYAPRSGKVLVGTSPIVSTASIESQASGTRIQACSSGWKTFRGRNRKNPRASGMKKSSAEELEFISFCAGTPKRFASRQRTLQQAGREWANERCQRRDAKPQATRLPLQSCD